MGAYLSKPITEKNSTDETCDVFCYGASSMQGWRVSQEDAHNCIPSFSENTSFFAVYDGHGGAEVAQYCSLHLPDYLKTVSFFKSKDFKKALEEAFLNFDNTLKNEDVMQELKQLAGHDSVEPEENETELLNEEAFMPLDELLAKYSIKQSIQPRVSKLKRKEKVQSPMIRAKKSLKAENEDNKTENDKELFADDNEESNVEQKCNLNTKFNGDIKDDHSDCNHNEDTINEMNKINSDTSKAELENSLSSAKETEKFHKCPESSRDNKEEKKSIKLETKEMKTKIENGEGSESDSDASSTTAEQGPSSLNRCQAHTWMPLTTSVEDNSDDDDDDEDFDENEENEDDDDDEDDDDEDDDDDKDDSEDEEYEQVRRAEGGEFCEAMISSGKDEPGQDSGCTAVVALLHCKDLYVANAGDSRCIVSRKGKALEMSVDHKPEDSVEMARIKNAGGRVTSDGRVNGGLNLSRAIGDHFYKKNNELPPEEQMITAFPDVRFLTLNEDDEFMVLACDGIWNFMTSQEVIDFIKERLPPQKEKLSSICEELFDHCLAPNTYGDGTGCDNMTCIIIRFDTKKLHSLSIDSKKHHLDRSEETPNKKIKLDDLSSDS